MIFLKDIYEMFLFLKKKFSKITDTQCRLLEEQHDHISASASYQSQSTYFLLQHSSKFYQESWGNFRRRVATQIRPGVNFINVLQAAFIRADPESAKKDSQAVNLFCTFRIYDRNWHLVSISPTFYKQLFVLSVLHCFSLLTVWVRNFLAKEYWRKSCL